MIKLGDKVEDVITGFKGIVIARSEWLNGCTRCAVQPPVDKDGKHIEDVWIDEQQLVVIKKEGAENGGPVTGGGRPSPMRNSDPIR